LRIKEQETCIALHEHDDDDDDDDDDDYYYYYYYYNYYYYYYYEKFIVAQLYPTLLAFCRIQEVNYRV
jgi:hypothetical protein